MALAPLTQTSQEGNGMGTWWNDFKNSVLQGLSVKPQSITSTTINGEFVDMKETQEGMFALLQVGALTGTLDVTLEEADDASGTGLQAITDFITGSAAAFAQVSAADQIEALNFKRSKRFVRAVALVSGGTILTTVSLHGMLRRVIG